jgi:hypothetical protein
MGEKRNAYKLLVGKPQRRRPLGIPRHRWVDNIRMDLVEVGWGDVDWIRDGNCLVVRQMVDSEEGLGFMELVS